MKKVLSLIKRSPHPSPEDLAREIFNKCKEKFLDGSFPGNDFKTVLDNIFLNAEDGNVIIKQNFTSTYARAFYEEFRNQCVSFLLSDENCTTNGIATFLISLSDYLYYLYHDSSYSSLGTKIFKNKLVGDVLANIPTERLLTIFFNIGYDPKLGILLQIIIDNHSLISTFLLQGGSKAKDLLINSVVNNCYKIEKLLIHVPNLLSFHDMNGNSLLFYFTLEDPELYSDSIFKLLLKCPDAKCIRGHKEIISRLSLMVVAITHNQNIFEIPADFLQQNIEQLNQPDAFGKTALHYAVILGKKDVLKQLLELPKGDISIADNSGRNILHYLILENKYEEFIKLTKNTNFTKALNTEDNLGLSALAMACMTFARPQNSNDGQIDIINSILIYPGYQKQNQFDQLFIQICQELGFIDKNGEIAPDYHKRSNDSKYSEAEAKLKAVFERDDVDYNIKRCLFCAFFGPEKDIWKMFKPTSQLPNDSFIPFGIELELATVPSVSLVPDCLINSIYNATTTQDISVSSSLLMMPSEIQEIVSDPITNEAQFELFLELCQSLETSGAMVNKSTGMHVHVNFNSPKYGRVVEKIGEMVITFLDAHDQDQIELILLKQIMINFAHIQPILQGFMRNGALFNNEVRFSKLVLSTPDERNNFLDATDMSDLSKAGKYTTVNLLNLLGDDRKGTIEFRCHEGSINPTIITAWVNFINRLVKISIDQVIDSLVEPIIRVGHGNNISDIIKNYQVKPFDNIEDLAYLLIADRKYSETWNKEFGLVPSQYDLPATLIPGDATNATDPNPLAGETAQKLIQSSAFYHSLQRGGVDSTEIVDQDLKRMLELQKEYPGIIVETKSEDPAPQTSPQPSNNIFSLAAAQQYDLPPT